MQLSIIPIEQIVVGERFREDYGDIVMLKESIKNEGIIQPLAVALIDGSYNLLAGGRRFKACAELGITNIPVRIYDEELSELQMRSIELMENIIRKDLSWIEATKLKEEIHKLQTQIHGVKTRSDAASGSGVGWSPTDTANLLGLSRTAMFKDLSMAEALKTFPVLKEAKNKGEAEKMLSKLTSAMVATEMAERIQKKMGSTPLDVQRNDLINAFMIGDFFEYVRKVPDGSVDIVEIDPPYSIGLDDYKNKTATDGGEATKHYNEVPVDRYIPFLNHLFEESYRCMSENSWIICWFAQEPWFEHVYQAMRRVGLVGSRIAGIWVKGHSTGATLRPEYNLGNSYEPFFYMRKGNPTIARQGRGNVFNYKPIFPSNKVHPTERPIEMIQDLLQTLGFVGARVMVPFLGSGNTLLASANLGMQPFGYELSEEYKTDYILKVTSNKPTGYKSYKEEKDADS